ncbi:MAG: hypothetical protein QNJ58_17520 [Desulfobacterales bacterium]|nr:hypothetical protein [Desulfobacterales bacterium]
MIKQFAFTLIVIMAISCGRDEPIANYEPKSPDEKALKSVLLDFQDGVNRRDAVKIINLIHDDASIMAGRERKILTRAEYFNILPKRLADNPPIALGKPKMAISGGQAEVKVYITRGEYRGLLVFNMKRVGDNWYIQSWQY